MLLQEAPLPLWPRAGGGEQGHGAPLHPPVLLPGSPLCQGSEAVENQRFSSGFRGLVDGCCTHSHPPCPGVQPKLRTAHAAGCPTKPPRFALPVGSTERTLNSSGKLHLHCREVMKGSPGWRASIPAQPSYSQELPLNVKLEQRAPDFSPLAGALLRHLGRRGSICSFLISPITAADQKSFAGDMVAPGAKSWFPKVSQNNTQLLRVLF